MSQVTVIGRTRQEPESTPLSIFDVLHNSLILANIVPHLSASGILNLAAADQTLRALIVNTPAVFRHLDLSRVKLAQFDVDQLDHGGDLGRNAQLDQNLLEDE